MRLLVQRVLSASVEVDNKEVAKIGKGLLVFVGVASEDTKQDVDKYLKKLIKLRIFEDENGKTNLSIDAVKGELLLVSQFTLMANLKDGNRPSFINAKQPDEANDLYEYMIEEAKKTGIKVEKGIFGADMKVKLVNDGPFTIVMDKDNMK